METLNEARLSIVLHQYLTDGRVLSPQEANQREPVFLGVCVSSQTFYVNKQVLQTDTTNALSTVFSHPEEIHISAIVADRVQSQQGMKGLNVTILGSAFTTIIVVMKIATQNKLNYEKL